MTDMVFKAASGGAALCRLATWQGIILLVAVALWLSVLLTALWPFVAVYILVWGPEELKQGLPFYGACWMFNAAGLFFVWWSSPPRG